MILWYFTCRVQNPDTQRAGRVGTAQGGRRGGATLGRTRCRHFGRLGSHRPSGPPAHCKTTVLNVSSQARTKEILCKPLREQNVRLTTGLSPGPRALFVAGCWPVYRRLFVLVNPFHAMHVRENVFLFPAASGINTNGTLRSFLPSVPNCFFIPGHASHE